MKTLFTIFSMFALLTFSSCFIGDEGPVGPQGPRGPQGIEGPQGAPGESGYVFEQAGINFTAPDYSYLFEYPSDFEVFDSDVAVVYLLWGQQEVGGEVLDIWRQLPQTILTPDGLLQYNFDFTKYDVELFLDAEFDLDILTADDTDDWVMRVVVVPGEFWNTTRGRVDFSDYYEVKEMLGLPELGNHENQPVRKN
ncbi:collagen-like protein [Fulvivirga sp. RKSG066]|uniref:collagen-like protein n=1 Tax=Fulvivirga aurantia TaxID=2529383 RepID=UPI0012BCA988|nr:collagen-like protein [Fulvivirga aurantia]MTI22138.1 collagen-like protein [Fulvivirga aurantia]